MPGTHTETKGYKQKHTRPDAFVGLAIGICVLIGLLLWRFILGNPINFEGGDNTSRPLPGNYFGMMYKGGYMVPILVGMLLMVIVFSIERFLILNKAAGIGKANTFIEKIQKLLAQGNISAAMQECDLQAGSVANVIKSALKKYQDVALNSQMTKEQKCLAIQKDIEEATALEMPMLEKNLTILATLVSVGTLMGLMGTVLGMIKSFAALATTGSPDQIALANGISEALINTATGIATSALAIIMYNVFTSKIDKITYFIDEAGFSIVQSFASNLP